MNKTITPIDPHNPEPSIIAQAAEIISGGGVVVIPTWCLYGLAVHALNPESIQRIFEIKKRPPDNPILILIKDRSDLEPLVTEIPPSAQSLMARFWPGRMTLVFNAQPDLPQELTAGTGKIGIRIPEHPVARALVNALPFPITGTSANLSGQSGVSDIRLMPPEIIEQSDLVLDAGPLMGGAGSTVVDVTCEPVRILREGAVPKAEIFRTLGL